MKAIVAEIDKKQMIVITDKGDFLKVKRQMSVGIGDEIELKPQKINVGYRRLASIAACFLACLFLSTGAYAYYTPYSYVSVDINPSIALSLNRFERIISVNPLNEDAVSLLEDTKGLKNRDIDAALSQIIKSAAEKGYIDEKSENQVMVVVSAKNLKQEKELTAMVTTAAEKELSKVNDSSEVMVEKTSVESYKEALSNKMSPGKEILADKLREVMPEIKDEEVRDMSVKEVVHLIKEGRKAEMASDKDKNKEDKGEQSAVSKDSDNKEDKGAAKADSKAEKDNNGSGKPKSSAASKDDKGKANGKDKEKPAAAAKSNEGKAEKGDKSKAVEADKEDQDSDKKDQDSDKEDEDKKKDNNVDINDKDEADDKGKQKDEPKVQDDSGDRTDSDDNDKEKDDEDKEKNTGKKGD